MARYLSGPTQPLGNWNNIPIYLTTILTAAFSVGLIGTALITAVGTSFLRYFAFAMPLDPPWELWRLFSYVFLGQISFFTPLFLICFYFWSVGIESHLGRPALSRLLLLLCLATPAVAAFWWWVFGHSSLAGGPDIFLGGLLVAFATLYPNSEAWGWIPLKWLAFACIVCGSFMLLAARDWIAIGELWVSCAVAYAYVQHAKEVEYEDYESPMVRVQQLFRRKPKLRVMPAPSTAQYRAVLDEPESELDVLLDKIAKSGMDSLTPKERATLEKAREALMRKDQR